MKRRLLSLLLTVGVGFSHVNTLVFAEEEPEQPETTEQEPGVPEEEPAEETDAEAAEETEVTSEEPETTEEAVNEETGTDEAEYFSEQTEDSDFVYIIENNEASVKSFKYAAGKESAIIPSTFSGYPVTKVKAGAFTNCTGLTYVYIPESISEMEYPVITNCPLLKTAGPAGSGTNIEFGWTDTIPMNGLRGCSSLTKLTVPASVKTIGMFAFDHCTGLTSAGPIGSGADYEFGWTDEIPAWAFGGLSNLSEIQIPSAITSIGNAAFYGCESLTGTFTVPDQVTRIGSEAFHYCSGLTKFIIPESVTAMGSTVFAGCTGLSTAGPIGSGSDIEFGWTTSIPANAFASHDGLESIQIPSTVTTIGRNTFQRCTSLSDVVIPPGVTVIEMQTFENCSSLTDIDLSNVETVRGSAFANCTNLSEIHMSNLLTTVEQGAFNAIVSKPTVYFDGRESEWKSITIKALNTPLLNANVIFNSLPVPETINIVNGMSTEIITGSAVQLTVSASPAGSDTGVTWSSSNPKVAAVSADGMVTALAYGKTVITAVSKADSDIKAEITVQTRFNDVMDASQSFFRPVYWGADNGVVAGYNGGEYFGPDNDCTRAQFVTFLWRLAGKPTGNKDVSFPDVDPNVNYFRAVKWAVSEGIIVGYKHDSGPATFEPEGTVTRGQVATMLWRFAGRKTPALPGTSPFSDINSSNSAYRAVVWGQKAGVIKGYKDGTFQPDGNCLRQHIVTFLYRYARDVMKKPV